MGEQATKYWFCEDGREDGTAWRGTCRYQWLDKEGNYYKGVGEEGKR